MLPLSCVSSQHLVQSQHSEHSCWMTKRARMLSRFSPVSTLGDSMDCSPPGSSVHGDSPGSKNQEWAAISFSRNEQAFAPNSTSINTLLWLRLLLLCVYAVWQLGLLSVEEHGNWILQKWVSQLVGTLKSPINAAVQDLFFSCNAAPSPSSSNQNPLFEFNDGVLPV